VESDHVRIHELLELDLRENAFSYTLRADVRPLLLVQPERQGGKIDQIASPARPARSEVSVTDRSANRLWITLRKPCCVGDRKRPTRIARDPTA